MTTSNKNTQDEQERTFVLRPSGQLHDYPIEIRWEVTRRHPYYQALWKEALRYRQDHAEDTPERKLLGYAATLSLAGIGVNGEPMDPALPSSALNEPSQDQAFLSGSVQPMTLRSVAIMLLTALPPADRAFVGSVLLTSGSEEYRNEDELDSARLLRKADELNRTPSAVLDKVPGAPLFYIHLGASQRAIVRDTEDLIGRWKQKRGLGSSKVHTAKLVEYLKVWDLREGWVDGLYDRSREQSFETVAEELNRPLSTVTSQYRKAFEYVIGQSFTPERWWQVFGPLKFNVLLGDANANYLAAARHRLLSPVRRPVNESAINGRKEGRTNSILDQKAESSEIADSEVIDMRVELRILLESGLSDSEIAERIHSSEDMIAEYRKMSKELEEASTS